MNYLAHLYLAERSAEGLLGSLFGDFVKGPLDDRYPESIRRGIVLHRGIDSFTDAHPLHLESRNRIGPVRRRYAGIIIDVTYDHFLCKYWSDYSRDSLASFVAGVYEILLEHRDDLPGRLRRIAPHMVADDWLSSYGDLANVGRALDGISGRITRTNPLAGAIEEVEASYAALDDDFRRFFPELEAYARTTRGALVQPPGRD
jgi:acyl carrier protein phosphodiesterase